MNVQTIEVKGERYVLLPESEFEQLLHKSSAALPPVDRRGRRPAVATARSILAQGVIQDRHAAGWSQSELARRAGIRQETISRIESGRHTPTEATMNKIDTALRKARTGKRKST